MYAAWQDGLRRHNAPGAARLTPKLEEKPMKILMLLGLAALLANAGCSTNAHLLEPGVNKYRNAAPQDPYRAGCCDNPDCPCGQDHMDRPCPPCQRERVQP